MEVQEVKNDWVKLLTYEEGKLCLEEIDLKKLNNMDSPYLFMEMLPYYLSYYHPIGYQFVNQNIIGPVYNEILCELYVDKKYYEEIKRLVFKISYICNNNLKDKGILNLSSYGYRNVFEIIRKTKTFMEENRFYTIFKNYRNEYVIKSSKLVTTNNEIEERYKLLNQMINVKKQADLLNAINYSDNLNNEKKESVKVKKLKEE